MIKECKVILRNPIHMVVMFDDTEVQMPTDEAKNPIVYVELDNAKYSISTKEKFESQVPQNKKIKVKPDLEEIN